jgi:hypothetical protein
MVLTVLYSLANEEVPRWQLEMQEKIGSDKITRGAIKEYLWETLNAERVIPGSVNPVCYRIKY